MTTTTARIVAKTTTTTTCCSNTFVVTLSMKSFIIGLVVGATTMFVLCSFHHNTLYMTEFLSLKSSSSQISESTTHEATDNIKSDSRQHQKEQQPHLRSSSRDSATDNERPFYDDEYDVCVVGAGLSGAVIAERYSSQLQQKVLIVEKRNHIGGNCYDYIDDDTGIRVSKYGAHLFHTIHDKVWQYVQQFSQWTKFEHEVVGIVDGKYVPIPVNINTVNMLFNLSISSVEEMDEWLKSEQIHYDHEPTNSEEMALSRVGPRLFKSIFEPYTIKQWAKHPRELGPEVTARIPVRNNFDGRYFGDPYQALPTHGYTTFLSNLMTSPLITVKTDTDYFEYKDRLKCKHTYYTGPVDTYFADLGWPKLEYRSLDFERKVVRDPPGGYFQPAFVVNHPSTDDDYTRIVEYKHLLNQTSKDTVIFIERSKDGGEPYYPVPNDENKQLYAKYQDMASKEPNVTFVGRLANYKYFNMDQAILNALELFERDTATFLTTVSSTSSGTTKRRTRSRR